MLFYVDTVFNFELTILELFILHSVNNNIEITNLEIKEILYFHFKKLSSRVLTKYHVKIENKSLTHSF